MIKTALLIILFFSACSVKTPQNEWQFKSTNAFNSYKKNFLSDNVAVAKNDLQRSIKHAKKSADLTQLASIYLGECSLSLAVGIQDSCNKYKEIAELIQNQKLNAYYHLITNTIDEEEIQFLPKNYKKFAHLLLKKKYKEANLEILAMDEMSSSLIASSIMKNKIELNTVSFLIEKSSFFGYKKAVIYWLEESIKYTQNKEKIRQIEKKIRILNTKI